MNGTFSIEQDRFTELSGENWLIKIGDVRETARSIPSDSIHTALTSIPYWNLRDYGYPFQIGLEKTPQLFVASIVEVFREVKRALRSDGVLFLNVGDTYARSGGTDRKISESAQCGNTRACIESMGDRSSKAPPGLPAGSLVGIPWMVAEGLRADGWMLRQTIIWHKPTSMPETVAGWRWVKHRIKKSDCPGCKECDPHGCFILRKSSWRPSTAHEFVFMFSKSMGYFCDGDGSKEPTTGGAHSRGTGLNPKSAAVDVSEGREAKAKANNSFAVNVTDLVEVRNLRSVWSIVAKGFKGAHFATFPLELVRKCLSASISKGGCCEQCGVQLAPIVRTERVATRPARNVKRWKADSADAIGQRSAGSPNRDPERHITKTEILGYKPCCSCGAGVARPVVLDPFGGAMRAGRVAVNMGCRFIGLEGSEEYARLGAEEIVRPYDPAAPVSRKKPKKPRVVVEDPGQLKLTFDD